MGTQSKVVSWGYLIGWSVLVCIGVVASFFVFFIAMSVLGGGGRSIPGLATSLAISVCFGTVTGVAQWSILRRYVQRSEVWIWITLLGFLVCSPIVISYGGGFGPVITYGHVFHMTIGMGAILGILQWLAISKKVKWSSVWVGVSFASWFLAGLVGTGLMALSLQTGPVLFWIGLFFAGIVLSVAGMVGLFDIKAEPAPREAIAPHRSIWKRIVRLPGSRLGWWSAALAVAYVILLFVPRAISGMGGSGQAGTLLLIMLMELCRWSAGIAGLAAVVEKGERSAAVWIAMLPAVYSLANTLYNVLRVMIPVGQ
jgi:hypothetical protein